MDIRTEIVEAEKRIRAHIRETPVEFSPCLSQVGQCRVYLKLENVQITSSFKLRGATNKLLALSEEEKARGVVTASSGNHGAACAYLLNKFGCKGTIYLPANASPVKIEALRRHGADLQFYGNDGLLAEQHAREIASKNQQVFISPYNDPYIIGGQGTIAIELARQIDNIDAVLVPVGGGGLIAGIASYLKPLDSAIEIIGCQPEHSAVMYESIKAGHIVDMESKPTFSDGTAGGIEPDAITFDLCKKHVDGYILVTEEEIRAAVKLALEFHHLLIEGAAALSIATFLKTKDKWANKNVVLILSGARLSLDALKEILRA